ncbi:hypothetical protein BT67DRAFT_462798 [Trichocladium antarcticum]|uniref:Cytochrome oxidase c assembly-domain-containing protein n=1 Tax=Trichocladium antarcticum TaxID=1450529 RepID=A0AAN6ZCZ4_9PEZI|nr:hypothetical protein BT67DRAFT_462798 [Trichocladium antarcticum]
MPSSAAPRSVSDATRFTATTPHASSKTTAPPPRFSAPRSAPAGGPGSGGPGSAFTETADQRVARLRAAHRRAKEAQVSRFDKFVDAGRRVFDSAHKVTVAGLVGFTVLAGLVTVYTAADMMIYNKKRGAEWAEAQKKLEADSLEAARIAYMTGKANEEQISLVEEQFERERQSGRKTNFFSQISVLGAPEPAGAGAATATATSSPSPPAAEAPTAPQPQRTTETVAWPTPPAADEPSKKAGGVWAWLTSNLKKEEEGTEPMTSQRRLGWESLSEEDDVSGMRESDMVRAAEDKQAYLRAKAHAAFEHEKEKQRTGGPLDQLGLKGREHEKVAAAAAAAATAAVAGQEETPKKKGWW